MSELGAPLPSPPVRQCGPSDVIALRQSVLRPHQTLDEVSLPGDNRPDAAHFCALDANGQVITVASVWREAPSWPSGDADSWRLRGMATAPEWRGKGAGTAVLAAVIAHAAAAGGGLLWCNARLGAVAFYERAGLVTRGEQWEEPVIGPHIAMFTMVPGRPQQQ